jgi:TRAP-type C4-dicarboxylate transport system substrate-binding protein
VLAAPVTIKLATLAPMFSSWHKALIDMGNAWTQATEGRVKLTIIRAAAKATNPPRSA